MSSGKLLDLTYNGYLFSGVKDINSLFKENLSEMKVVKGLYNAMKLCFNLPGDRITMEVAEGERIYKYTVLTPDIYKYPLGWFVYIPKEKRLDFYSQDSPNLPLIQWKGKKPVWKGYADILDRAKMDKIFSNIINVLN